MNEKTQEAMLEIKKQVAVEINKMIKIEADKKGISLEEAVRRNKTIIRGLEQKLTKKAMSNNPILREIKIQEEEEMKKKIKQHKAEQAELAEKKRKEKIANSQEHKKALQEYKEAEFKLIKQKEETEKRRLLKLKQEKIERDIARQATLNQEKNHIENAMRIELERERLERQLFAEASRANKVFSDDSIQKSEEVYYLSGYWTYEEEKYLLALKRKKVSMKNIAYLLDRSIPQISFKLSEIKKQD